MTWQYNGVAPWIEIEQWCLDRFGLFDTTGYDTVNFSNEKDYIMFLPSVNSMHVWFKDEKHAMWCALRWGHGTI